MCPINSSNKQKKKPHIHIANIITVLVSYSIFRDNEVKIKMVLPKMLLFYGVTTNTPERHRIQFLTNCMT